MLRFDASSGTRSGAVLVLYYFYYGIIIQTTFSFYDSFVSDTNCSLMIIQTNCLTRALQTVVTVVHSLNLMRVGFQNKEAAEPFRIITNTAAINLNLCFESFFKIVREMTKK